MVNMTSTSTSRKELFHLVSIVGGWMSLQVSGCLLVRVPNNWPAAAGSERITNLTSDLVKFIAPLGLNNSDIRILSENGPITDFERIRTGFTMGLESGSEVEVEWSPQNLREVSEKAKNGVRLRIEFGRDEYSVPEAEVRIKINIRWATHRFMIQGVAGPGPLSHIGNIGGCRFLPPVPLSGFMALIKLTDNNLSGRILSKLNSILLKDVGSRLFRVLEEFKEVVILTDLF